MQSILIDFFADIGGSHFTRRLSEYVHNYEGLDYDTDHVIVQHQRHKRSAMSDDHKVRINFASHGRDFDLELKRDHSVFHNDLVIERGDGQPIEIETSHIYDGGLEGNKHPPHISFFIWNVF